jgi:leucine-rich repeat protein SHOC2
MPNWMSYRGEGCSLSFHIPPVFQGLVVWFDKDDHYYFHTDIIIIIINKSNGIQLFEEERTVPENENNTSKLVERTVSERTVPPN